jgi:hypothetical protein
VISQLNQSSARVKHHPPASHKAMEAQAAAKAPPNEKRSKAQARQVDKVQQAPTQKPEPTSFLTILRAEIAKAMPKTLGDTEKFMKGGSAEAMKGSLKGNVEQQKDQATGHVKSAAQQSPNEAGIAGKRVTPIPGETTPPTPNVNGGEAMPGPKPDSEVSLQSSKQETDQQLKQADVTPTQLQKANDPRFSAVLTTKDQVGKQADRAPAQYRASERTTLGQAAAKALADSKSGAAAMMRVKSGSKNAVLARQQAAKAKDEAERLAVAAHIEGIYNRTKAGVETKLSTLEEEVNRIFDAGVDAALATMKAYVEERIFRYKLDRYLSIPLVGQARWVRDQFKGLPNEVNVFYEQGRKIFTVAMDAVIRRVAALVETRLRDAKRDVAKGQREIQTYVNGLDPKLRAVGREAQRNVAGRFAELEQGIEDKKNQIAQQLAQKYKEAFDKANEALQAIQDENKGLVAAFVEKLAAVIKMIKEFKAKLMAVIKKGEEAIKLVLADPIGFLGNLLAALKLGFNRFVANIWDHLKKGFMTWLFGELASSGIAIPTDLSLGSILKLVLGVLGLTWERAKTEAVKMIGPTAVTIITKVVEYIQALWQGGPAALWEKVKEDLSNLKAMVIDAIQDWLIVTIVKKAVAKIVSMFNPVGAIIQAISMIYNVVMFVIERASQILAFVEAVVNSIATIAKGNISAAATWIEAALGRLVPVVIGLLAGLLGLGGIGAKIKELVTKAGNVVWGAIRKFFKRAIDFVKKMWGKLTGKKEAKPDERTDAQKKADLDKAVAETNTALAEESRQAAAKRSLKRIKERYRLTRAEIVVDERKKGTTLFHAELEINPIAKSKKVGEMDFIDPPIKVTPNFFCKKTLDQVEFKRQIKIQEDTINAMNVHKWLANRFRFKNEGRSAEGTKLQRQTLDAEFGLFRARLTAERANVYKKKFGLSETDAKTKAEGFANRLLAYTMTPAGRRRFKISQLTDSAYDSKVIQNELFKKAALHAVDQVAGGEGTDIVGLGGAREDFSIGAQWRGQRIEKLQENVEKEVKNKKDDERKNIRMNVTLEVDYE